MGTSALKILRESHDYTQEFVAGYIEVSQSTYGRLESDPSNLTLVQAEKLSKLYNVSLSDINSVSGATINFNDSIKNNTSGSNGYHANINNNYNDSESSKDLKEIISLLTKQNSYLIKLLSKAGLDIND